MGVPGRVIKKGQMIKLPSEFMLVDKNAGCLSRVSRGIARQSRNFLSTRIDTYKLSPSRAGVNGKLIYD